MCGSSSTTSTRADGLSDVESPARAIALQSSGGLTRPDRGFAAAIEFVTAPPPAPSQNGSYPQSMKRKTLAPVGLIVAATIGAGAYYSTRAEPAPALTTAAVTRGDIVNVVSATGTLQAVTTVQVGQPGVGHGRVAARRLQLDRPQGAAAGEARRSRTTRRRSSRRRRRSSSAEAEVERLRVAMAAADAALARARELTAKQLLPAADLQSAETASQTAAAQVVGARRPRRAGAVRRPDREGESGEDRDPLADRRRRHRAQRGRRPDRGGEPVGADAVRHRGRSVGDAAEREHRRVGSRTDRGRPGCHRSRSMRIRRRHSAAPCRRCGSIRRR